MHGSDKKHAFRCCLSPTLFCSQLQAVLFLSLSLMNPVFLNACNPAPDIPDQGYRDGALESTVYHKSQVMLKPTEDWGNGLHAASRGQQATGSL